MRNFLLAFFFISSVSILNAQQQIDSRIRELYGDKTNEMVSQNPELLNFLNDLLTNRIKIKEEENSKIDKKFPKLSEVKLLTKYNPSLTRDAAFDPVNFNPLKYNFDFSSNSLTKVYHVDNTNYIIVIEPQTLTTKH